MKGAKSETRHIETSLFRVEIDVNTLTMLIETNDLFIVDMWKLNTILTT